MPKTKTKTKTKTKPKDKPAAPPPAGKLARTVRARIDGDLKASAEAILSRVGLNPSDAIRLFYTHITLVGGLPFDVRIPNAETRKAIRDARAGRGLTRYADFEEFEKAMLGDG
jgi:DNA-damage-inducible protein J